MHVHICRTEPTSAGQFSQGVVWNCSKVALLAMSQLASHYGFMRSRHDWHDGNLSAYSNFMAQKTNELQTALSIQMTQSFVPRFRPPEGNKPHHIPHHRIGASTGGRLVLLLAKSEAAAKRLPWLDVMHMRTICNSAPFLMLLRIVLLLSFTLAVGWMREIHHLKCSYESGCEISRLEKKKCRLW